MVVLGPADVAEKSLPVAAVLDVRLEVRTSLPLAKWLAARPSRSGQRLSAERPQRGTAFVVTMSLDPPVGHGGTAIG